ncbi:MAG TPA: hypothetical protein VK741_05285 [Acetobacteraceae bacterium]|jgi:hypothetical protein|nr:hypothetical protein [Acetobacteraceae bacterium]
MMMFLIRNDGRRPEGLEVKLRRRTPALVARGADLVDWFCLGDPEAARNAGHSVVMLHDGWYADDAGGGVTVFGPYWEIRDTPFTVREAAPDPASAARHDDQVAEIVNVRKAIFGA